MSVCRVRLGWALAVVLVLAAALVPAAGATVRGVQPASPWYAYDAALRNTQHQRQHAIRSVKPTNPWSKYEPAHDLLLQIQLKKAQHQRHVIRLVEPRIRP
jgi:hypothetical protein